MTQDTHSHLPKPEPYQRLTFSKAQNIRVNLPSRRDARMLEFRRLRRLLSRDREGGKKVEKWFHGMTS